MDILTGPGEKAKELGHLKYQQSNGVKLVLKIIMEIFIGLGVAGSIIAAVYAIATYHCTPGTKNGISEKQDSAQVQKKEQPPKLGKFDSTEGTQNYPSDIKTPDTTFK